MSRSSLQIACDHPCLQRDAGQASAFAGGGAVPGGRLLTDGCRDVSSGPEGTEELWTAAVPADGLKSRIIRWRIPEGGKIYTAYVKTADGWQKTESEVLGSCRCFTLAGSDVFSLVSASNGAWWIWALAAAGAVFIGAILLRLLIRKSGRKKQGKRKNFKKCVIKCVIFKKKSPANTLFTGLFLVQQGNPNPNRFCR